jgi:ribonuclease Z
MRPLLHPRLVNGPFDDPALYISFLFDKRALLIDIGDIRNLSPKEILKIDRIFISHTHMDHFIGFDHLLRLFLGRDKTLFFYGPEGFLENIEGKLAGYSWNLVNHYTHRLVLQATEVHPAQTVSRIYPCASAFRQQRPEIRKPFSGLLFERPGLSVQSVVLDHRIPCLGFRIEEDFHVNILKDRLEPMGLAVGPWLKQFKETLYLKTSLDEMIRVPQYDILREFRLGDLADHIAVITSGQKISYISDAVYSPENETKMIALSQNADHLFIEAAFLEKDRMIAREKYHLTAREAGTIARKANVGQFTIFHHSPRYLHAEHLLYDEARAAFESHRPE